MNLPAYSRSRTSDIYYSFWVLTPCSPLRFTRFFGGNYRLHFQCRKTEQDTSRLSTCFYAGIFLGLLNPENGGDMFPWNVVWLSTSYMKLYARIQSSSCENLKSHYFLFVFLPHPLSFRLKGMKYVPGFSTLDIAVHPRLVPSFYIPLWPRVVSGN